ncbi:unnamed protein product [Anisakis simplex]|uniref:Tnp_DNA_bind domain-containing protein n=1 Tax=Anisakis simplex TaxID=6269 RepID=A0A0M3JFZ7_ANISI|nr:unnamed protein product [Anisakis simplex]
MAKTILEDEQREQMSFQTVCMKNESEWKKFRKGERSQNKIKQHVL